MRQKTIKLYSEVKADINSGMSAEEVAVKHGITTSYARNIASQLGIYFAKGQSLAKTTLLAKIKELAPTHTLAEAQAVIKYGSANTLYSFARKNGVKFKRQKYQRTAPFSTERKSPRSHIPASLEVAHAITTSPLDPDSYIAQKLHVTREYVGQIRAYCRDLGWNLSV